MTPAAEASARSPATCHVPPGTLAVAVPVRVPRSVTSRSSVSFAASAPGVRVAE